jgi:hypothetical protein
VTASVGLPGLEPSTAWAEEANKSREFYELRTFVIDTEDAQKLVHTYVEMALVPALGRAGLDRIGVFTRIAQSDEAKDHSVDLLIPYRSLETLGTLNDVLFEDKAYVKAAAPYFARPMKSPAAARMPSRLMHAFRGMPVLELPKESKESSARLFELRIYESHHEDAARRKVDMFNEGEIDIMREVGLAPVFYGETLISDDVPNLTYMLSAPDMEAHQAHWKAFGAHPEWTRMKAMDKYKDTVSKITKRFLAPASCSQI